MVAVSRLLREYNKKDDFDIIVKTPVGYRPIYFSDLEPAEGMIEELRIEDEMSKQVVKEYD